MDVRRPTGPEGMASFGCVISPAGLWPHGEDGGTLGRAMVGELLGLQWGDIDWHGRFVEVRRAHDLRHAFASPTARGIYGLREGPAWTQ